MQSTNHGGPNHPEMLEDTMASPMVPKHVSDAPWYGLRGRSEPQLRRVRRAIVPIATIAALGTVGLLPYLPELWQRVLVAAWGVMPPLWFLYENAFLNPADLPDLTEDQRKTVLERFKYTQDLARNVWVAMGLALAVVYLKKSP
jgi:hypothetical protein